MMYAAPFDLSVFVRSLAPIQNDPGLWDEYVAAQQQSGETDLTLLSDQVFASNYRDAAIEEMFSTAAKTSDPQKTAFLPVPKQGLQVLMLTRWSTVSAWRLGYLLSLSDAPTVTLAIAPWFGYSKDADTDLNDNGVRDAESDILYQNVRSVVEQIHSAGKNVRLTFFLNFHGTDPDGTLGDQATKLSEFLNSKVSKPPKGDPAGIRIIDIVKSVKISPALEDNYRYSVLTPTQTLERTARQEFEIFAAAAQTVASKFTGAFLKSRKLMFVRSTATKELSVSLATRHLTLRGSDDIEATVRLWHEFHHKPEEADDYDIYASDGPFVYSNGNLDKMGSKHDESKLAIDPIGASPANPGPQTLNNFIKNVVLQATEKTRAKSVKEVLLWRPNYNLQAPSTKDETKFDVDHYAKDTIVKPEDVTREDSTGSAFGRLEWFVALKFLGMARSDFPDAPAESNTSLTTETSKAIDPRVAIGDAPTTNIPPKNQAPVLGNDERHTHSGAPTNIHVFENDTDPDGDKLNIRSITQPVNGTLILDPDQEGRVIYTSNHNLTGIDTFTYRVGDGHGLDATATVTVIVENQAPILGNDERSTRPEAPTNIHVFANDSDPDGDELNIRQIVQPAHGSVILDPDHAGRVVYTSDQNFHGIDTFQYRVGDGHGKDAWATVTVNVVNAAPILVNDSRTLTRNRSVNLHVLGNDSDPDGDHLNIRSFTQPAHGHVERDQDHSERLIYTPDKNFTGTDTFRYRVGDGFGLDAWATVTLTIQK